MNNIRLTKQAVELLPLPNGKANGGADEAFYWDNKLAGFGVRLTVKGGRRYVAQARLKGATRRITLGKHGVITCEEARKQAQAWLGSLAGGVDPKVSEKSAKKLAVTLNEVVAKYCEEKRTKNGSLKNSTKDCIKRVTARYLNDWADKPIAQITREACALRFREVSAHAPAQANQCFRYLRAVLNFAREMYRTEDDRPIVPENPVSIIKGASLWNANKARKTRIPTDKVGAVWNHLSKSRYSGELTAVGQTTNDFARFLILTGCRFSEAASLRWDLVNLDDASWQILDTKNHNSITLPLSLAALDLLRNRPSKEGFVFSGRSGDGAIKDARAIFETVSGIAGLHLTPHDMRRTFVAIAHELKIELWRAELLTNHVMKTVTTIHYTETNDLRYLRQEVENIAGWVLSESEKTEKNAFPS